jgi:16S rRNA G966 N2-methylase RsmD
MNSCRPPTLIERQQDAEAPPPTKLEVGRGKILTLQQATWDEAGTGSMVWPAAEVLCGWMSKNAHVLRGSHVLELGCGTGACGLFAAGLGAASVLLTDGSFEVMELVGKNVSANAGCTGSACVSTQRLQWGRRYPPPACAAGKWQVVLASDCAYTDDRWESLAQTMKALLQQGYQPAPEAPPRILMSQQHRSAATTLLASPSFKATLRANGLQATTLDIERNARAPPAAGGAGADDQTVAVSIVEVRLEGS